MFFGSVKRVRMGTGSRHLYLRLPLCPGPLPEALVQGMRTGSLSEFDVSENGQ